MKKSTILIIAALICFDMHYSFAFELDGILYKALSDSTVEVIGTDLTETESYYCGNINIPATIKYDNTEYKVTSISNYTFSSCHDLYSVEFPEGITSIGSGAFMGCQNLCSVNIPQNITVIESYTFWGCHSLTSITIPDNVEKIEVNAFYKCDSLTEITLPNSVVNLGPYSFSECESLSKINLSSSIKSIPKACFIGCSSLHEITLPESIVSIDYNAFKDTHLESMTVLANEVVDVPSLGIYGVTSGLQGIENATLYVPSDLVSSYKNHAIWSKHFSQILPLENRSETGGVEKIEVDQALPFDVYNLSGVLVRRNAMKDNLTDLTPGVYILRQGNASQKFMVR